MWRIQTFVFVFLSPSLHIYIRSDQIFTVDQVFHPVINGEVKGCEQHVVTFVVPNVYTSQKSMVMTQKVEGGSESRDVEYILLLYNFPPSRTIIVT